MHTSNFDKSLSYKEIADISYDRGKTVHFVGVGGVSMYSLAGLTADRGARVQGSDREDSPRLFSLRLSGAEVFIGHIGENVRGADLVVYSHAILPDNPELTEAKRLGIPTVSRAEYLGALMLGYKSRIGVSGSHGKSSTTAMLDLIFSYAGTSPTTLSGADLTIGGPLRLGSDGLMIYEACEYRDSFLRFCPTASIALNLELDHTDYFADLEELKHSFAKALGRATEFALINGDDQNLKDIADKIKARVITFGASEGNTYRYMITSFKQVGFGFSVLRNGVKLGDFELNIPGVFNIANATAAIAVSLEYGIDVATVSEALALYRGIPRRLEYIGSRFNRPVFYDYAHHPTEIKASIDALKMQGNSPLTVIFKPHTYSRTRDLWDELCSSLSEADHVLLTDIYPAREEMIEGINSVRLAEEIGDKARYCRDDEILTQLDFYTSGAIVLMGAGDLEEIKRNILK
jgi:UDP-N-acetylmuramate--alanine ligase